MALQGRFPDPGRRPSLYGALVAVKDILHVDGFVTRAGTQVPPELFAGPEATCVTRLRAAGALILDAVHDMARAFCQSVAKSREVLQNGGFPRLPIRRRRSGDKFRGEVPLPVQIICLSTTQ